MSAMDHYFPIAPSKPVLNATYCEWQLLGFPSCATRDSIGQEKLPMSDHYWLTETQFERIRPYFPRSHGKPRVDDRRVIGGIVHVIRNGLRWRDAPEVYGSHKTLYNRFVRWTLKGIFDQIFSGLVTCNATQPEMTDVRIHSWRRSAFHRPSFFGSINESRL